MSVTYGSLIYLWSRVLCQAIVFEKIRQYTCVNGEGLSRNETLFKKHHTLAPHLTSFVIYK